MLEANRFRNTSGVLSKPFEFVVGFPTRFQVGGAGGLRSLRIFPRPAPVKMWSDLNRVLVAHCCMSFDALDRLVPPRHQVVERSKPTYPGGEMTVYLSRDDTPYGQMERLAQLRRTSRFAKTYRWKMVRS